MQKFEYLVLQSFNDSPFYAKSFDNKDDAMSFGRALLLKYPKTVVDLYCKAENQKFIFSEEISLCRSIKDLTNITESEALFLARKYNLEIEVMSLIQGGYSPLEALYEWDLI